MLLTTILCEASDDSISKKAEILKESLTDIINWLVSKAGSILIAIFFILIGLKVVSMVVKLLKKSFDRSKMDASVSGFLLSLIKIALNILVFITAATILGFDVTSFVTILGTAGIAVGLALQGSLSNLAGGVLILILKPFQVGDYIKEDNKGNEGTVTSIDIFYTRLVTVDNRVIVIPNGVLSNSSLTNVTKLDNRRVDFNIGVGYGADIKKVKTVINSVLDKEERILNDMPKDIFINSFDESSVDMGIRVWVKSTDYFAVLWDLREAIKETFDNEGIEIPFNQLDVSIKKD